MANAQNIKVLTVCREIHQNIKLHKHPIAEFIFEQNEALEKLGIEFDYYLFQKSGPKGYAYHAKDFIRYLRKNDFNYDLIHAHGGHIGSIVNIQRKIPVITTYHGSDINVLGNRIFSFIALILSKKNIFVSKKLLQKVKLVAPGVIIPCGVNFDVFKPLNKTECRKALEMNQKARIVLFAGQRHRKVKNFNLAEKVAILAGAKQLKELIGMNRDEVVKTINACDCILLTSFSEGSPMIIKEALACNRPVVSVDVGDVKEITNHIPGTFVSDFDANTLAQNLTKSFEFDYIESREQIRHLDNQVIAQKIYKVYLSTLKID